MSSVCIYVLCVQTVYYVWAYLVVDAVVGVFLMALGHGELGKGNEIVSGMGPNKNHKYPTIKTIKGLGHKMYNLVVSFLVTYRYTFLTSSKRCESGLVGDASGDNNVCGNLYMFTEHIDVLGTVLCSLVMSVLRFSRIEERDGGNLVSWS